MKLNREANGTRKKVKGFAMFRVLFLFFPF